MAETPSFTLAGGQILYPDGLSHGSVTVDRGRMDFDSSGCSIDCAGFLILPGIIDLHGDAFERHLAPRRGALRSLDDGLRALEGELAANGITTAYLPQFWSWEGGMRGPDFARDLCAALADFDTPLDMRLQLRLEIACHDDFAQVATLIADYGIDYLVLNDHLPHDVLAAGKRPPRLDGQAIRAGRSPVAHLALMRQLHDGMPLAREKLAKMLGALDGVRVGSHDDSTPEQRARSRALGARIAEFPTSHDTAEAARRAGDVVILGAPNVVRGGSHDKGASARALIGAGLCDGLASDYHYPSLHRAAFMLVEQGQTLAEAWAQVSTRPAVAMGMTNRGTIAPGQRADLVILEERSRRIVGTIAQGRFAYLCEPLASRVLQA